MFGIDGVIGTSAVKVWLAVGSVGFLIGFYLLAYLLPRFVIGWALRTGFLIVSAGLGAKMAWTLLDYTPSAQPGFERRSLEIQAEQLNAQALAPGSPLACLDALAGEAVEAACEKELFTSPASVAAATSFVARRVALLAALLAYEKRSSTDIHGLLRPLRRSLEADRFGFLAHVLALRDGCTSEKCKALALLDDPGRVRANLSAQTLDHYVEHYAEIWAKAPNGAHAAPDGAVVNAVPPSGHRHKIINIDFPTAASIPPVSIMSPEPTGPVLPGVAAAAATNSNPQQASLPGGRRARKTAVSASSAQSIAQPPSTNAVTTEPIWPEPVPPPPAATGNVAGGPMQLAPPEPSANSAARLQ
jgi:hypothetical protein